MTPKMQPEIFSRNIVKPLISNPNNHPTFHNFSFFDQIAPTYYVSLLFFYTSNKNGEFDDNRRSTVLKTSLSAALSHYYPLAGRIKDDVTIHCNDDGALFLEARIECGLSDVLENPEPEILKVLCPDSLCNKDSSQTGPVAVQVTYFQCGGMSIGLCMCHKTFDMASMTSFIDDWASLARKSNNEIRPEFSIASLYPPINLPILKKKQEFPVEMKECVSRRFVFHGSEIDKLKEMVADQVLNPTRVEVVALLLYKSTISANAKASSSGSLKPSVMNISMSLRDKISPPLSKRNKGNILGTFQVSARDEREIELGFFVKQFRKAKTHLSDSCASITNKEDLYQLIMETRKPISEYLNVEHEVYFYTSWCRYPFYEADFGWEKPLWVSMVPIKAKNVITLLDTREGDGIEAFINLEEKVMAIFENDQELLSFSSINPSILDT